MQLKLGNWYEFDTIAVKRRAILGRDEVPPVKPELISSKWGHIDNTTWSIWTRDKLSKPQVGMYAGYRTVRDGIIEYMGEDEGNVFIPQNRSHRVLMFVVNARKNLIRVFPEDVTPIVTDEDEYLPYSTDPTR